MQHIREAIARIDLSIALAHLGSLDEAVAQGSQAFSSGRVTDPIPPGVPQDPADGS